MMSLYFLHQIYIDKISTQYDISKNAIFAEVNKILYSNNMLTYLIGTFKCACYIITFFNIIQMLEELSYDKAVFNYRFFMFIF